MKFVDYRVSFLLFLICPAGYGDIFVDFENRSEGAYSQAMMQSDFDGLNWSNGLDQGRAEVVSDNEQGKVLRVLYPRDRYGAGNTTGGGVQFKCDIGSKSEAATAQYKIKFKS
ncbi:MAG: hypothetical protein GF398_01605 [Chitinivibrionales bacterium]|nr:hypothetical protein [Chitinivibrionales bacterium]